MAMVAAAKLQAPSIISRMSSLNLNFLSMVQRQMFPGAKQGIDQ